MLNYEQFRRSFCSLASGVLLSLGDLADDTWVRGQCVHWSVEGVGIAGHKLTLVVGAIGENKKLNVVRINVSYQVFFLKLDFMVGNGLLIKAKGIFGNYLPAITNNDLGAVLVWHHDGGAGKAVPMSVRMVLLKGLSLHTSMKVVSDLEHIPIDRKD